MRRSRNGHKSRWAIEDKASMGNPSMIDNCSSCDVWELRFHVAVRATYYLVLHIREISLREAVLEHMTAAWALRLADEEVPHSFDGFFADYRRDVECDRDESTQNTALLHTAEYQRVWTNHAAVLSRRLELLQPRFDQAAA